MVSATPNLDAALGRLWLDEEQLPGELAKLRIPVRNWLSARARCLGDPSSLDWILNDPIVGHLAPAIFGLSGRALDEGVRNEFLPFFGAYLCSQARWEQARNQINKILSLLAGQGIPAILLKGAALQVQVYYDSGIRDMGDIDLLVKGRDFIEAVRVLNKAGLSLHPKYGAVSLDEVSRLPLSAWPNELSLSGQNHVPIDLHRNLLTTFRFSTGYNVDIEDVWRRGTALPMTSSNKDIRWTSLSAEDTFVHLCLHQALHGLQALKTYLDIDLFIRSLPGDWNWDALIQRLERWQLRSASYHTLTFCRHFMQTPLPTDLLRRLDPGPSARFRIAKLITAESLLENQGTLGRRYPALVKLMIVDRVSQIAALVFQAIARPGRSYRFQNKRVSLVSHWKNVFYTLNKGG